MRAEVEKRVEKWAKVAAEAEVEQRADRWAKVVAQAEAEAEVEAEKWAKVLATAEEEAEEEKRQMKLELVRVKTLAQAYEGLAQALMAQRGALSWKNERDEAQAKKDAEGWAQVVAELEVEERERKLKPVQAKPLAQLHVAGAQALEKAMRMQADADADAEAEAEARAVAQAMARGEKR